ncbi:zinc-binding dehydrogenase [Kutzneria sp. NPDC052558]|uniref:zinc-binding dehydrogenase n=1 Tax=Kutzneria sp. NPDC052558 TaxID=3364121 RepID=UPI0037CA03B7
MLALVKTGRGPEATELLDVPVPHAGPGQIRLRVTATGICGTDLHLLHDEYPSAPPVVMGHEITGVVDEVGTGGDTELLGRRVALETYGFVCGACEFCRSGQINLCPARRSIGVHLDGGFADHVVAPQVNAHVIADELSDEAGALYEPLACVANCLCDPAVASPGDSALVIGPGTIGLLAAEVLCAQGCRVLVVGAERDRRRLAVANELGFATATSDEIESFEVDVVAECSGSAAGVASGLRHVRKGGRFVQIGLCGKAIPVELDLFCLKEVVLSSGFASTPRSWARAERLVRDGHVRLEPLLSERLPLSDWSEAFARTAAGDGVKFVLVPGK